MKKCQNAPGPSNDSGHEVGSPTAEAHMTIEVTEPVVSIAALFSHLSPEDQESVIREERKNGWTAAYALLLTLSLRP